jgi:hypothetical protein
MSASTAVLEIFGDVAAVLPQAAAPRVRRTKPVGMRRPLVFDRVCAP